MRSSSSAPSPKNDSNNESRDESFGIIPVKKEQAEFRYLVIQHRGGHWGFPKGHAEPGETPIQTATRELKEETGLSVVRVLDSPPLVESYQFRRRHMLIRKEVLFFLAEVEGSLALQEKEIAAARWCDLQEAWQLLSFAGGKKLLEEASAVLR